MTPVTWLYLIALLAGITCALSGTFLVLRKSSMVADAISHSILPGLVAGFWIANGPNLWVGFAGAVIAGMLTVAVVEWLKKTKNLREDSALGLIFPTMFALGVLWISSSFANVHLDSDAVLFGDITTAAYDQLKIQGQTYGPKSIWVLAIALVASTAYIQLLKKETVVATFDPGHSHICKFNPMLVQYLLMLIVAFATVAAFTAVGAILSVALIVVPTVCATLLSRNLNKVILLSGIIGIIMSLGGTSLAMTFDVSISGMIASLLGFAFLITVAFAPNQGIIAKIQRRKKQKLDYSIQALIIHLVKHKGDPNELIESSRKHLVEELGWTDEWMNQVVDTSIERQLVQPENGHLLVTSKGEEAVYEFAEIVRIDLAPASIQA